MAHRSTPRKPSPTPASEQTEEARRLRHEQFMESQQAKGLLHPEEEWEARVNLGLEALFGPAPAGRRK
jgi:hypothetical protein